MLTRTKIFWCFIWMITIGRNVIMTENKPRWSVVSWKIIRRRQRGDVLGFPEKSRAGFERIGKECRRGKKKLWEKRLRCETAKDSSVLRRPVGIGMRLKTLTRNRPPGISNDSHSQTVISYYTYFSVSCLLYVFFHRAKLGQVLMSLICIIIYNTNCDCIASFLRATKLRFLLEL